MFARSPDHRKCGGRRPIFNWTVVPEISRCPSLSVIAQKTCESSASRKRSRSAAAGRASKRLAKAVPSGAARLPYHVHAGSLAPAPTSAFGPPYAPAASTTRASPATPYTNRGSELVSARKPPLRAGRLRFSPGPDGWRELNEPRTGTSACVWQAVFCIRSRTPRPSAPAAHSFPSRITRTGKAPDFRGCRQAARRRRALRRSRRPMRWTFRATTERATTRAKPVAPCARIRSRPRCSRLLIADSTAGC